VISFSFLFVVEYLFDGDVIELDQGQAMRHMVSEPAGDAIFGKESPKSPGIINGKL